MGTLTGGLKAPCALTSAGKEEYYQQYPWFTDKNEAETATKLDVNLLFLLNCMFPHWNTSVNNCSLGEGGYLIVILSIFPKGVYLIGGCYLVGGYLPDSTVFTPHTLWRLWFHLYIILEFLEWKNLVETYLLVNFVEMREAEDQKESKIRYLYCSRNHSYSCNRQQSTKKMNDSCTSRMR